MKLIVEPFDFDHAKECINNDVDAIVVGQNTFSVRNSYNYSNDEIEELIKLKGKTNLFLKVNSFFFEEDIENLEKYLIEISKKNIDAIIFSDYAVAQINDELNLNLRLRYNPETLVTSYFQFPFYEECKFSSVSLSRELTMFEIKDIIKNKINSVELEMQCHGYLFFMHSRWNLISNFEKYYNTKISHDRLSVQEELRTLPNLLREDSKGTHMFSGFQLCSIPVINDLKGIDWLRVDTINMSKDEAHEITTIYNQIIKQIQNGNIISIDDMNNYMNKIKKVSTSEIALSFLGGKKDMLHMRKKNE